jgi:hypothetical protein
MSSMSSFLRLAALFAVVYLTSAFQHAAVKSRASTMRTNVASLVMKGKGSRIPINQRGEFMKRQKMLEQKENLDKAAAVNKKEGVPVFKVFVRPKAGGLWIPCGDLAGDQRATALVNAWMSGFMSDMYKGQLDSGIARSIFSQEDSFAQNIIENFKPFRKLKKEDLEFGFKVEFEGLEEKMGEQKITVLQKGMEKTWIDNAKESLGGLFGGKKE